MKMDFDGFEVFVRVVEFGSFSGAARSLAMPVTTLSGRIARLEERLGMTLIRRSTRRLYVTEAGQAFYRRAKAALMELESGIFELGSFQEEPRGTLRVTAAVDVGASLLPRIAREFTLRAPEVRLDLLVTNQVIDLLKDGVDIAIRPGALAGEGLMSRVLCHSAPEMWASEEYVKQNGTPSAVKDLKDHRCIGFTPLGRLSGFSGDGQEIEVPFEGNLRVNDFLAMKELIAAHLGIGILPDFLLDGSAVNWVRILPEIRFDSFSLMMVYMPEKHVHPAIRIFLNVAQEVIHK